MVEKPEIHWLATLARLLAERETLSASHTRSSSRTGMLQELLDEYRDDLEKAEAAQKQGEADARAAERDVALGEDRIASARRRLEQIRDNDEYRAHLKEIETLQAGLQERESKLLDAYGRLEKLAAESEQAKQDLFEQDGKITAECRKMVDSKDGSAERGEQIEEQITRCREQLPPDIVARVTQLEGGLPLPVVWIDGGACGGCHGRFPAQVALSIANGKSWERCQSCGRLVVGRP